MKEFVLMWVVMTPNPEGTGYLVHKEARGPMNEHTCLMLSQEMNDLAAHKSEPHALISTCRKLDPEVAEMMRELTKKDDDVGT